MGGIGALKSGKDRLATMAIRQLRRRELGTAPAVIYLAGCYSVFALEELLSRTGSCPGKPLLPWASLLLPLPPPNNSLSPNVCADRAKVAFFARFWYTG